MRSVRDLMSTKAAMKQDISCVSSRWFKDSSAIICTASGLPQLCPRDSGPVLYVCKEVCPLKWSSMFERRLKGRKISASGSVESCSSSIINAVLKWNLGAQTALCGVSTSHEIHFHPVIITLCLPIHVDDVS